VTGIKSAYPGPDSSARFRDCFIQCRSRSDAERIIFRNSDMMTKPDDENVYFPPVCEDFMIIPIPTCYNSSQSAPVFKVHSSKP
jgi:hypothetical protein